MGGGGDGARLSLTWGTLLLGGSSLGTTCRPRRAHRDSRVWTRHRHRHHHRAGPGASSVVSTPQATATGNIAATEPRRWWALTVIAAATLMVVPDTSIINLVLPKAQVPRLF